MRSKIFGLKLLGTTQRDPLKIIPLLVTSSSLTLKYGLTHSCTLLLLSGQPCVMTSLAVEDCYRQLCAQRFPVTAHPIFQQLPILLPLTRFLAPCLCGILFLQELGPLLFQVNKLRRVCLQVQALYLSCTWWLHRSVVVPTSFFECDVAHPAGASLIWFLKVGDQIRRWLLFRTRTDQTVAVRTLQREALFRAGSNFALYLSEIG